MSRKSVKKSGNASQLSSDLSVKYKPYFQVKAVYFTDDSPYMYVNRMRYRMDAPTVTRGDNILAPADCLAKIYSPDMTVTADEKEAVLTYKGVCVKLKVGEDSALRDGEAFPLEVPSEYIDGHFYLDVEAVMTLGFGKTARWEVSYLAPGDFLGIADTQDLLFENREVGKDMLIYKEKKFGVLRRAYYYEEGRCMQPYLLYVPFTYDPEKPNMLTVLLHGAGGGVDVGGRMDMFGRVPTMLETAAENHNMMLLLPEGYSFGFYGGGPGPDLRGDLCSPEEQACLKLCEHEPMAALAEVLKEFNVDEKNIFITGNSMGGAGTFWLAKRYPDVFRACAPGGALTDSDLSQYDLTPLRGKPLLMVCGSENIGFDNVPAQVEYFRSQGVPAEWIGVPGGIHATAWVYAFDKTLDFLVAHKA